MILQQITRILIIQSQTIRLPFEPVPDPSGGFLTITITKLNQGLEDSDGQEDSTSTTNQGLIENIQTTEVIEGNVLKNIKCSVGLSNNIGAIHSEAFENTPVHALLDADEDRICLIVTLDEGVQRTDLTNVHSNSLTQLDYIIDNEYLNDYLGLSDNQFLFVPFMASVGTRSSNVLKGNVTFEYDGRMYEIETINNDDE